MGLPHILPELEFLITRIRQCPTGEKLARNFIDLNNSGSVSLQWADKKDLNTISAPNTAVPSQIGGGTRYDGKSITILLVKMEPLELVTPLLVHEITHALDQDYLNSYAEEIRLWSEFKNQAEEAIRRSPEQAPLSYGDYNRLKRLHVRAHIFYRNRLYQTERKAFLSTYYWIQEMKIRKPTFQKTLNALEQNGYQLDRWKTEDQTRVQYRLK